MISRELISKNFRYKTNEYNARYGWPEEKFTNLKDLEKRIDYWKYIFYKNLRLAPGNTVCFCFTHSGIDAFAVIFAAAELSLIIVPTDSANINIDLFLHTLPETDDLYKHISLKSQRCLHQIDLAGLIINDSSLVEKISAKRALPDAEFFVNTTHEQVYEILNEYADVHGTVLHTKIFQTNNSILNLINSLSQDTITEHIALGYNNLEQGIFKIVLLIKEFKIDNVFLNNSNELNKLQNSAEIETNAIVVDNKP